MDAKCLHALLDVFLDSKDSSVLNLMVDNLRKHCDHAPAVAPKAHVKPKKAEPSVFENHPVKLGVYDSGSSRTIRLAFGVDNPVLSFPTGFMYIAIRDDFLEISRTSFEGSIEKSVRKTSSRSLEMQINSSKEKLWMAGPCSMTVSNVLVADGTFKIMFPNAIKRPSDLFTASA